MNLREYQAKRIFARRGIAVPRGDLALTADEAARVAVELGCPVVIKPQLGIKKRGKLGLIRFADDPASAAEEARELLSREAGGESVSRLLVEERARIDRELYLAVTVDHRSRAPVLIAARSGGVDVEELAAGAPGQVLRLPLDVLKGPGEEHLARLAAFLDEDPAGESRTTGGADPSTGELAAQVAEALYGLFRRYDVELTEINPLAVVADGLLAVDAVLNVNDDALFRQEELSEYRDTLRDPDPLVEEARASDWTYIELPGEIAILSSGAGLTMTILDLINFAGGSAANFIDTAQIDEEGIYRAFDLLSRAGRGRCLLVNIFAGLNRCDSLARGIVRFLEDSPPGIPLVIRMVGNREREGHAILREAGLDPCTELEEAVERAVESSREGERS